MRNVMTVLRFLHSAAPQHRNRFGSAGILPMELLMPHKDLFAAVDIEPPDIGPNTTIAALAEEAVHCTRCHLYRYATQTVFGAGPSDARIIMVGEQPGDQEDLQGAPFVGPAGKLL